MATLTALLVVVKLTARREAQAMIVRCILKGEDTGVTGEVVDGLHFASAPCAGDTVMLLDGRWCTVLRLAHYPASHAVTATFTVILTIDPKV